MTKFNWSNFPVIPGFDALKMKADIQAEILRETEGMTRTEVREYFRQAAEQAKRRRAERAKLAESVGTDN
jgi:hypothetical protein